MIRLYLRAHSALHTLDRRELLSGLADDISQVLLFSVALGVTLLIPPVGYFSLFAMALSGPAQKVIRGILGADRAKTM